jgi:hypothetical protein
MGVSREAQWKRAKIKGAFNILAQQLVKSMGSAAVANSVTSFFRILTSQGSEWGYVGDVQELYNEGVLVTAHS